MMVSRAILVHAEITLSHFLKWSSPSTFSKGTKSSTKFLTIYCTKLSYSHLVPLKCLVCAVEQLVFKSDPVVQQPND